MHVNVPTVVIVGGGFSGLLVSRLLQTAMPKAEILVLEAAPRAGGRIETGHFGRQGVAYGAGAAELYEYGTEPLLEGLLDELGLKTRPMTATPIFVWRGRVLRGPEDIRAILGRTGYAALRAFWKRCVALRPFQDYWLGGRPEDNNHPWARMTFAEVLAREIPDDGARAFTTFQVHSDVATEPWLTSGLFGLDNLLIDYRNYCRYAVVEGGNERIVTALVKDADLELEAPVDAVIPRRGGRHTVVWHQDGRTRQTTADAVVVTVPPPALSSISWARELEGPVRRHARHHGLLTHYLRVTLLTRSRFWAADLPDDYFVMDTLGGATVYDQSYMNDSGRGVLSWLCAGEPAASVLGLPDRDIVEIVLRSCPKPLSYLRRELLDAKVDRFRWGVSRLPGGTPIQSFEDRHSPGHFEGLWFTGDYMYDATINGAQDGADRVACSVARALGGDVRSISGTTGRPRPVTGLVSPALPFLRR